MTNVFNEARTKVSINEDYESYLIYNGLPDSNDDPADYYDYSTLKGARIA